MTRKAVREHWNPGNLENVWEPTYFERSVRGRGGVQKVFRLQVPVYHTVLMKVLCRDEKRTALMLWFSYNNKVVIT